MELIIALFFAVIIVLALDKQSPDTRIQAGSDDYSSSDEYSFGRQMNFNDISGVDDYDHDWMNPSRGIGLGLFDDDMVVGYTTMFDDHIDDNEVNPVTGLPMIGGICGVDVMCNPYGFDSDDHWNDPCESSAMDELSGGVDWDDFSSSGDIFGGGGSDDW